MVKIIENKYKRRCVCVNCNSILEYELHDIEKTQMHMNEYSEEIKCPACLKMTGIWKTPIPKIVGGAAQFE